MEKILGVLWSIINCFNCTITYCLLLRIVDFCTSLYVFLYSKGNLPLSKDFCWKFSTFLFLYFSLANIHIFCFFSFLYFTYYINFSFLYVYNIYLHANCIYNTCVFPPILYTCSHRKVIKIDLFPVATFADPPSVSGEPRSSSTLCTHFAHLATFYFVYLFVFAVCYIEGSLYWRHCAENFNLNFVVDLANLSNTNRAKEKTAIQVLEDEFSCEISITHVALTCRHHTCTLRVLVLDMTHNFYPELLFECLSSSMVFSE